MSSIDLDRAAQTFSEATDLTIGIEEEFAIVDPETLELVPASRSWPRPPPGIRSCATPSPAS